MSETQDGGETQPDPHKGHPVTPAFQSPHSIPELTCVPRCPCPAALELLLLPLPFSAQRGSAGCCREGLSRAEAAESDMAENRASYSSPAVRVAPISIPPPSKGEQDALSTSLK